MVSEISATTSVQLNMSHPVQRNLSYQDRQEIAGCVIRYNCENRMFRFAMTGHPFKSQNNEGNNYAIYGHWFQSSFWHYTVSQDSIDINIVTTLFDIHSARSKLLSWLQIWEAIEAGLWFAHLPLFSVRIIDVIEKRTSILLQSTGQHFFS